MRKFLTALTLLLATTFAWAQDSDAIWARVKEVNLPGKSLEASWKRVYRSPMLVEELVSEGKVYLREPGQVRWETLTPFARLSVFDGTEPRGRFRMPREKDFKITVLEGEEYIVRLDPVRKDLEQLVGQITLHVQRPSCKLQYVTVKTPDGAWSRIDFSDILLDRELPDHLFKKP